MDKIEVIYKQCFEKSTRGRSFQLNPEMKIKLDLEMTKQSRLKVLIKKNKIETKLDSRKDEKLKEFTEIRNCLCKALRQFK